MTINITILLTKHSYICLIGRLQLFDKVLKHGNINVWVVSWFSSRALSTWSAVFSCCSWTTSTTTRSRCSCLSSRTLCPWLPRRSRLSWWTLWTWSMDIFIGWSLVIHLPLKMRTTIEFYSTLFINSLFMVVSHLHKRQLDQALRALENVQ